MTPRHSSSTLAALVLSLLPVSTTLAATYRVTGSVSQSTGTTPVTLGIYDNTGYAATGNQAKYDNFDNSVPNSPSYHISATSLAGPDGLHASSHAAMLQSGVPGATYSFSQNGTSFASGTYTTAFITGPVGATPARVSFNLHLDGSDIVGSTLTPAGYTYGQADTQMSIFVNDQNIGGGYYDSLSYSGGDVTHTSGGVLAGFTGNYTFSTPTFLAPVNTPFTIQLTMSTSSGVYVSRDDQSIDLVANADFGNTLTFATDRPVFNLPAGYTANVPDAGIINNTFSVPEPTSLCLILPFLALGRRGILRHPATAIPSAI